MNHQAYQAAHEAAAWRNLSHFGRFLMVGKDAADLLHHLTTNDIKGMTLGSSREAVLLTNKARVLDWLTVVRRDDGFLVITSPNRREMFRPHAQKFILFRQDVQITDVTDATALVGLFGPQSEQATIPEATQIERTTRLPGGGGFVLAEQRDALLQALTQSGLPQVDDATYNVLRVEAGLPVAGLELTEEVNPWEARLDAAISLRKGCYNGQEIIARLNTYKKVKQRLFGLRLEHSFPVGQRASLTCEGRDAGYATSCADSPRFGPIALAYVRSDFQEEGRELELCVNGEQQKAVVAGLPFTS